MRPGSGFCKRVLHGRCRPWPVLRARPQAAGIRIAAGALPAAGGVCIPARQYGIAPQGICVSNLIVAGVIMLTVTLVIARVPDCGAGR
ncbi:MAG: hypothetical protein LW715_09325 [Rhodobacter sp.]|nr:hypothetical protein [Rhodobacter sp.]MCE2748954.1 hypothetical protein [Rhodobacter sp.]